MAYKKASGRKNEGKRNNKSAIVKERPLPPIIYRTFSINAKQTMVDSYFCNKFLFSQSKGGANNEAKT